MIQVYLIDGVAGISILLFAVAIANLFQSAEDKNLTSGLIAGVVAGTISLVQAGVQQTLVNTDLLGSQKLPFAP